MKLFDKDGNEVEAFTQEELDEKLKEEVDKAKGENADKIEELGKKVANFETLEKENEELKGKLEEGEGEGGKGESGQAKRLKEDKEKIAQDFKEYKEKTQEELDSLKGAVFGGAKQKAISKFAEGDDELAKKIDFEYSQFKNEGDSPEDIESKIEKAARIVNAEQSIPFFNGNIASGSDRGDLQKHKVGGQESEASKEIRKELGVTDKDVEKYGSDDEKTKS